MKLKIKKENRYQFIADELADVSGLTLRKMFGCLAIYRNGLLYLVLADSEDDADWDGVCVCTDRDRHAEVLKALPMLVPHKILPKWLFLSARTSEEFEAVCETLIRWVRREDPRIGTLPKPKKKKKLKRQK